MIKEVIIVPQDRCPLDILADMGKKTENAWIFLHRNAVQKLQSIADDYLDRPVAGFKEFNWEATEEFPKTSIQVENNSDKIWLEVYRIDADDISFHFASDDPCHIFFIQMAE